MMKESLKENCSSVPEECDLEMERGVMKKNVGGLVDKLNLINNFSQAASINWTDVELVCLSSNGGVINAINFSTLEKVLVLTLLPYESRQTY